MAFRIDVHLYVHSDTDTKLDQVLEQLAQIQTKQEQTMKEIDELEAQVTENTTVEQSAITLLNGIAAQIEALKQDPARLTALSEKLKTSAANLAAAVSANTTA